MSRPDVIVNEARRVLTDKGVLSVSWTSDCREGKIVKGWMDRSGDEQVDLVKELLILSGMHPTSLRVEVSGPTNGPKLFLVSGSPAAKQKKGQGKVKRSVIQHHSARLFRFCQPS